MYCISAKSGKFTDVRHTFHEFDIFLVKYYFERKTVGHKWEEPMSAWEVLVEDSASRSRKDEKGVEPDEVSRQDYVGIGHCWRKQK